MLRRLTLGKGQKRNQEKKDKKTRSSKGANPHPYEIGVSNLVSAPDYGRGQRSQFAFLLELLDREGHVVLGYIGIFAIHCERGGGLLPEI